MLSIDEIGKRLEKLEKAVFGNGTKTSKVPRVDGDFNGIAGGVRFLLKKSFFTKKRTAAEAKTELEQHGYHYQRAVVQTALNRVSVKSGPLTTFQENGVKVYVARK